MAVASMLVATFATGASSATSTANATPALVAGVPGTSLIYVVAAEPCSRALCLATLRTSDNGAHFTRVGSPPGAAERGEIAGTLDTLVFANRRDGYALVGANEPFALYVTTDGAQRWRRATVETGDSIYGITATAKWLYAVAARCHGQNSDQPCGDYRLARSSLAATTWSLRPLPSASLQLGTFDGTVAAYGVDVWISSQTHTTDVYTSDNGGVSYERRSEPKLGSVSGCHLTAMNARDLWAECPTGMMASFFFSSDGGASWRSVHQGQYGGTGGGFFAPVTASLAILDYGAQTHNIYHVVAPSLDQHYVGDLACANVLSEAFTSARDGLVVCTKSSATTTREVLEATSDGGATWRVRGIRAG